MLVSLVAKIKLPTLAAAPKAVPPVPPASTSSGGLAALVGGAAALLLQNAGSMVRAGPKPAAKAASKLFKVTLPKLVVSFAKRDGTTAVLKVSPLSPFLPLVKALSNFF